MPDLVHITNLFFFFFVLQGLCLKLGKKQEQFSFENQGDCQQWKSAIENVFGLGGVEELLSEDEEADENAAPGKQHRAWHL